MKKKFLITTVGIIVLSFTACRYIDNAVDHVIAGDAHSAARGFKFPLDHGGFSPLMQIKNKSDFIRLFPIMFDKGVREELKRMKKEEGWGFRNWRGEMFGNGAFWRDNPEWEGADKRIHTVLITGEEFDKYYQKVYAKKHATEGLTFRCIILRMYCDMFPTRIDPVRLEHIAICSRCLVVNGTFQTALRQRSVGVAWRRLERICENRTRRASRCAKLPRAGWVDGCVSYLIHF